MVVYVCPPRTKPPRESLSLKPLLNAASSLWRRQAGTSIEPRGSDTDGSDRTGLSVTEGRLVLIHASPASTRGYSGWSRQAVWSIVGATPCPGGACFHIP